MLSTWILSTNLINRVNFVLGETFCTWCCYRSPLNVYKASVVQHSMFGFPIILFLHTIGIYFLLAVYLPLCLIITQCTHGKLSKYYWTKNCIVFSCGTSVDFIWLLGQPVFSSKKFCVCLDDHRKLTYTIHFLAKLNICSSRYEPVAVVVFSGNRWTK